MPLNPRPCNPGMTSGVTDTSPQSLFLVKGGFKFQVQRVNDGAGANNLQPDPLAQRQK